MVKTAADLQTLDMEIGIMLELHGSFSNESLLLSRLKQSFNKDYTTGDLDNLKRYHDFINHRKDFENVSEFTLEWYNQNVK